ncbi:hypothetical protein [[Clostridium] innocuum]|uniref:hypothetical protein n=1 Tax=Clostridium innocuum TaxID=1522 RepID=UPI000D6B5B96|nr:hypothetical protein [[Clostridium] innocuum]MCR0316619.1 hypothetical protein [[Clostridium] innocuum]MCR0371908.1 hypothetical protein [[Clostridium] innocuum]MCR0561269.1 hypothetical protein [[Clostridium] innocuum]MCR0604581.1 hypothetical protein [[Clostridium] innocuum]PWJ10157.1 hypothetical protein ATF84_12319 [[Clostridium] innocuum]
MFKDIIEEIINPTGILIGFFISVVFDRLVGDHFPTWSLIALAVGWFIYYIFKTVIKKREEEFEHQLREKDVQIETLIKQTNNMSLLLADKISVFSKNADDILLKEIVRDFTVNNKFIDGLQLYCYDSSICQENIKIKCNSVVEYVRDDYELNTVSQIYYSISFTLYEKIKEFYKLINEINNENLAESISNYEPKIKKSADNIINLIKEEYEGLLNRKNRPISESELYQLRQKAYSNIEILDCLFATLGKIKKNVNDNSNYQNTDTSKKELILSTFIKEFKRKKRTGMLGCILTNNIYVFHNVNSEIKRQRKYMCFPFIFRNKKMIASFAISRNFSETYLNEFSEHIKIKKGFLNMIAERTGM